ncbi:hypothetical protein EON64_03880 [archaeon]|nr:MAG: hypothetical protein EON64_03880 [archaeon]
MIFIYNISAVVIASLSICRRTVEPCVDLKMLLAPFTDLDSDPSDLQPKWNAAKCAFLLLMKSWVGIVYLVSDENALGMLVSMLRDRKVACFAVYYAVLYYVTMGHHHLATLS